MAKSHDRKLQGFGEVSLKTLQNYRDVGLAPGRPKPVQRIVETEEKYTERSERLFFTDDYLRVMLMPRPFVPLSPEEFVRYAACYSWTRRVWRVDMHHTWFPTHKDYVGETTIEAMRKFHVNDLGWDDIAQHVSIAPDGTIWTGRDWNKMPASVGWGLNKGVFMFETIGNFDEGEDVLCGPQLDAVVTVICAVQSLFALPPEALLFHREVPVTTKTCPGTSIGKADILKHVRASRPAALKPLEHCHELAND